MLKILKITLRYFLSLYNVLTKKRDDIIFFYIFIVDSHYLYYILFCFYFIKLKNARVCNKEKEILFVKKIYFSDMLFYTCDYKYFFRCFFFLIFFYCNIKYLCYTDTHTHIHYIFLKNNRQIWFIHDNVHR